MPKDVYNEDSFNARWFRKIGNDRCPLPLESSNVVTYFYDTANRLRDVTNGAYNVRYSYFGNSRLVSSAAFRNNATTRMTTSRTYDRVDRLLKISSTGSGMVLPESYAYDYNSASQRVKTTLADGSYWVYKYDTTGQLTSCRKFYCQVQWGRGSPEVPTVPFVWMTSIINRPAPPAPCSLPERGRGLDSDQEIAQKLAFIDSGFHDTGGNAPKVHDPQFCEPSKNKVKFGTSRNNSVDPADRHWQRLQEKRR